MEEDDHHPMRMKRLLREKSLKKPYQEGEKPKRKISRPNGTLIIRERNEEEENEVRERNEEEENEVRERNEEEENEVIAETEDSRCPVRNDLDVIIEIIITELDDRWNEVQQIGAGLFDLPMGDAGEDDALREDFRARIREMNGSHLILVLQKQLFMTDIGRVQNRLSFPERQISRKFLTGGEDARLTAGEAMKVKLIEPSLEVSEIILKKWKMDKVTKTCYVYNLTSKWNAVVKNNSLGAADVVQIWSFRIGTELCFAIVRV